MMFSRLTDPIAYENNWAFFVQETRFGGHRLFTGDLLLTAVRRHPTSPYIFVFSTPGGVDDFGQQAIDIASRLQTATGLVVVFRKIVGSLVRSLTSTGCFTVVDSRRYSHVRDVPEDVWPQVVISVDEALALQSSRLAKARGHVRYFEARFDSTLTDLTGSDQEGISRLAEEWTRARDAAQLSRSDHTSAPVDTTAYTIFADAFGGRKADQEYFGKILRVGPEVAGFAFAGRVSATGAALYCCLALRKFRGATDFLLRGLLQDLSREGIRFLNMGGSETEGLFAFKNRQAVVEVREALDLEFECN